MKSTLVLFCPRVSVGIYIYSISAGGFAFNSSFLQYYDFLVSTREHIGRVDLECSG